MITIITTRFIEEIGDCVIQEKAVRLFGWVVYRWQERLSRQQPGN